MSRSLQSGEPSNWSLLDGCDSSVLPLRTRGRFTLISPGLSLSAFVAMEGLPRRAGCIDPNSIDLLAVNSRGWCFPLLSLAPLSSSVLFIQTAEVDAWRSARAQRCVVWDLGCQISIAAQFSKLPNWPQLNSSYLAGIKCFLGPAHVHLTPIWQTDIWECMLLCQTPRIKYSLYYSLKDPLGSLGREVTRNVPRLKIDT